MKAKKCPTCDLVVSEGSIRRNRALEEIVDAWEESRYVRSYGFEAISEKALESDVTCRATIIQLIQHSTSGAKKRPPVEPNSKASSSGSNPYTLKRIRGLSRSRSASPKRRCSHGSFETTAAEVEEEGIPELAETGKSPHLY